MPLLAFLLAAVLLVGCGGGGETAPSLATEPAGSEVTGSAEATEQPEPEPEPEPAQPILDGGALDKLERFAEQASGQVSIAVSSLGDGKEQSVGEVGGDRAWSTMKVPVLVTLLDRTRDDGGLSSEQRSQAATALASSDNEAALALFASLEKLEGGTEGASAAIDSVLRRAGDKRTKVNTTPSPEGYSTFGQTRWPAEAANTFFRSLAAGCLLPEKETRYVLSLMGDVVPEQSWGLGEASVPSSEERAFKGGWGPEPGGGYLVRQSGVVFDKRGGYALSVIAIPEDAGPGAFEAGQAIVSDAADQVVEQVDREAATAVTCER